MHSLLKEAYPGAVFVFPLANSYDVEIDKRLKAKRSTVNLMARFQPMFDEFSQFSPAAASSASVVSSVQSAPTSVTTVASASTGPGGNNGYISDPSSVYPSFASLSSLTSASASASSTSSTANFQYGNARSQTNANTKPNAIYVDSASMHDARIDDSAAGAVGADYVRTLRGKRGKHFLSFKIDAAGLPWMDSPKTDTPATKVHARMCLHMCVC